MRPIEIVSEAVHTPYWGAGAEIEGDTKLQRKEGTIMKRTIELKLDIWTKGLLGLVALGLLANAGVQLRVVTPALAQLQTVTLTGSLGLFTAPRATLTVQCPDCKR
jgi:hypothetical protein